MNYGLLQKLHKSLYKQEFVENDLLEAYDEFLNGYDFTYATVFYKILIMMRKRNIMITKVDEILKVYNFILFPVKKVP